MKIFSEVLNRYGYIAVTELTLLEKETPAEVRNYRNKYYPDIRTTEENPEIIRKCGLSDEGHFTLPESAWYDDFYIPMGELIRKYRNENTCNGRDELLEEELKELETEIYFYRNYSHYFGYVFYVMRKM